MTKFNTSKQCFTILSDSVTINENGDILITILSLSFFLTILFNTLMIVGLKQTNKKLSLSKRMFMLLSINDLITCFTTIPFQIIMSLLGSKASCVLVAMQAFFNCFTPSLSISLLFMVSLIRYCVVLTHRSRLKLLLKPNNVAVVVSAEIIFSFIFSLAYVYVSQTLEVNTHACFLIFVAIFCLLFVSMSLVINMKLLFFIKTKSKVQGRSIMQKSSLRSKREYHGQVTTTLLILSILMIVLYSPMVIAFSVIGVLLWDNEHPEKISLYYNYCIPWTHAIIVCNCFLNSLVYICRSDAIKHYLFERMIKSKPNKSDEKRELNTDYHGFSMST